WTFALDNSLVQYLAEGETVTVTYTITITDDSGAANASQTQDVTVVITGTNDAPAITVETRDSDSAGLTETDLVIKASGTLTVVDADLSNTVTATVESVSVDGSSTFKGTNLLTNDQLKAMLTVTSGAIDADTGATNNLAWNFNSGSASAFDFLPTGETLVLTYTVKAEDSDSATANDTQTVTVTITGTNDAPITSVSASGWEDSVIEVKLSGTDADGTIVRYTISTLPALADGTLYTDAACTTTAVIGTPYAATNNAVTLYFKPSVNWNGESSFTYTATDNDGLSSMSPATAKILVGAVVDQALKLDDAYNNIDAKPGDQVISVGQTPQSFDPYNQGGIADADENVSLTLHLSSYVAGGAFSLSYRDSNDIWIPLTLTADGNYKLDSVKIADIMPILSTLRVDVSGGYSGVISGSVTLTFRDPQLGDVSLTPSYESYTTGSGFIGVVKPSGYNSLNLTDVNDAWEPQPNQPIYNKYYIFGMGGADKLSVGNYSEVALYGGSGDDTLTGSTLSTASDTLVGGAGNDTLIGGAGADTFSFSITDVANLQPATDLIQNFAAGDTLQVGELLSSPGVLVSAEYVAVSTEYGPHTKLQLKDTAGHDQTIILQGYGTDQATADNMANVLKFASAYSIGDKYVPGTDGNDTLRGEAGNDVLRGEAGDDVLRGWAGNDVLTGGTGSDTFVFSLADAGTSAPASDRITDFSAGDTLQINDLLSGGNTITAETSGGNTILHIKNSGAEIQTIELQGYTVTDPNTILTALNSATHSYTG
ncbi:VCBS domain-containing protein, partial [Rhodocyclus purpureus]|uniref:VCBS domain-containing protein n=1 Tax=Rhodocyclus purpureus TaxID=1067 RepID=UPI001912FD5F